MKNAIFHTRLEGEAAADIDASISVTVDMIIAMKNRNALLLGTPTRT